MHSDAVSGFHIPAGTECGVFHHVYKLRARFVHKKRAHERVGLVFGIITIYRVYQTKLYTKLYVVCPYKLSTDEQSDESKLIINRITVRFRL